MSASREYIAVTPPSSATIHMSPAEWSVSTLLNVSTHVEDMSAAADMGSQDTELTVSVNLIHSLVSKPHSLVSRLSLFYVQFRAIP